MIIQLFVKKVIHPVVDYSFEDLPVKFQPWLDKAKSRNQFCGRKFVKDFVCGGLFIIMILTAMVLCIGYVVGIGMGIHELFSSFGFPHENIAGPVFGGTLGFMMVTEVGPHIVKDMIRGCDKAWKEQQERLNKNDNA